MERDVRGEERRDGRAEETGAERQDAGEGTELSNGCEYIAVINFAKTPGGEAGKGSLGRSAPLLSPKGLLLARASEREAGGRTKKSRRKAVERASCTVAGHVSGTCAGVGHLCPRLGQSGRAPRWRG